MVEVKIEYPPKTAWWLINPTAKISITSQRNDGDPLHFSPIKLSTLPILYRGQHEDIQDRRVVEGVLRIVTLWVEIASILSQLFYSRDGVHSLYLSCHAWGSGSWAWSFTNHRCRGCVCTDGIKIL